MLPFSPYPILLKTLNTMLVTSSERIFFFTYHRSQDFFFLDKFLLQDFFGGLSPHFWLFLMVRPLVLTKSPSRSRPRLRI